MFGYGFIWILSGQLLRNNQSYQGDYFHQGFQPFVADNAYVKMDSHPSTRSTIDYKTNVSKLLKYESVLRLTQKQPFLPLKNAIQIQRRNWKHMLIRSFIQTKQRFFLQMLR